MSSDQLRKIAEQMEGREFSDDPAIAMEQRQDAFLAGFVGAETYQHGEVHYVDSTSGELRTLRDSGASVPQPPDTLRLVLISDTHEQHGKLDMPPGDVLVHTGDLLLFNSRYRRTTSMEKLSEFNRWLGELPYRECVVIGGNHDASLEALGRDGVREVLSNCTYLENEAVELEWSKLRVFGSPASVANLLPAWRGGGKSNSPNKAFQSYSEQDLDRAFRAAPADTDLLLIHGPIDSLPAAQEFIAKHHPPLVISGHVHEGHGVEVAGSTLVVNATTMGPTFAPTNAPMVIDVPRPRRSKL